MFIQITDSDGDFHVVPLATAVLHTCYYNSIQPTKYFINKIQVTPDFYDKVLMKIEKNIGIIA